MSLADKPRWNIKTMVRRWNQYAKDDPLWIILTHPEKRGSWDPEEFFTTGSEDVDGAIGQLKEAGVTEFTGTALDFGCGVGRLSQALTRYYDAVVGVDVSKEMVTQAKDMIPEGMAVSYVVNEATDLSQFQSNTFNLVFSLIVLQHIHPDMIQGYLKEFARILQPGGHLFFQLPTERLDRHGPGESALNESPKGPRAKLSKVKYDILGTVHELKTRRKEEKELAAGGMIVEMHGIPKQEVIELLEGEGLRCIQAIEDMASASGWKSYRYLFTKPGS